MSRNGVPGVLSTLVLVCGCSFHLTYGTYCGWLRNPFAPRNEAMFAGIYRVIIRKQSVEHDFFCDATFSLSIHSCTFPVRQTETRFGNQSDESDFLSRCLLLLFDLFSSFEKTCSYHPFGLICFFLLVYLLRVLAWFPFVSFGVPWCPFGLFCFPLWFILFFPL